MGVCLNKIGRETYVPGDGVYLEWFMDQREAI